jgi:uroporphyrinogen-III synthase
MSDKALSDLNVLLTRPEAQSAALVAAIHALGGHACELPLIKIEPVTAPDVCERIKACILNLDHYCAAIFISTNAAKIGMQWIDRFWPQLPAGLIAYAVGPGTAQVLRNFDWPVVMSDRGVTSEDLLALTGLQKVEGKKSPCSEAWVGANYWPKLCARAAPRLTIWNCTTGTRRIIPATLWAT